MSKARTTSRRTPFLWVLRPYFRQVLGLLVLGSVAGIAMNVAIVLPAVFLGRAIDTVLAFHRHRANGGNVAAAAVLFLVASAATQLPRIGKRWWLGLARTRLQANVRSDALRGVLAWPMDRVAALSVGGVMARVIGDVEVLGLGVGEVIVETWDTLLFSVSLVVTMFLYSPRLAALALAPVPVALLLAKVAGRVVALRTTTARQVDADLTTVLHEQLVGVRLLQLTGRIQVATRRVRALAQRQASAELDAIRVDEALGAVYATLLSSGVFFVIWFGGQRVAAGTLSVGGLVAFLQLFIRFVGRAPRIPQMANRVQAAGAAYVRLQPMLSPPPPISAERRWSSLRATHVAGIDATPEPGRSFPHRAAALSFQNVSFTYPGGSQPAVDGLDLEIAAGSFVAVTGPVGAGKSAAARLAAGIYEPDAGLVLWDGQDLADLPAADRAGCIGYLGQEPHLFSGTVAANISLDPEATADIEPDPTLEQAVSMAALGPDLRSMPCSLGTEIGELGVRVSGGQRQRIALARALHAGGDVPALVVIDEPFSAVDVRTEAAIISGLRSALGPDAPAEQRRTVLLFSHRLAAFPHADRVVVLDRGRVEEEGTHAELLDADGRYARIFRAQARLGTVRTVRTVRDVRRF